MSLLSWERGLKYICNGRRDNTRAVAPLVGAWIEMIVTPLSAPLAFVAPLVGAWIEINVSRCSASRLPSLLSWERGLKFPRFCVVISISLVAPLVGAWIEMLKPAT